mgnify:CR=1 FL=1
MNRYPVSDDAPRGRRQPPRRTTTAMVGGWLPAIARTLALALSCGALPGSAQPGTDARAALTALPWRMAWAWERPEDLRWLPPDAGVAYVAVSLWLEDGETRVGPRRQPLRVRPDTPLVPVVHVDASASRPPRLLPAQRQALVDALVSAAAVAPRRVVQLDFEARASQRAFLADVVREARRLLPPDVALSITALGSWCAGDAWLDPLPADEVVPMAFRMAHDSAPLRALLARRGHFPRPECARAIGSATDEPLAGLSAARHYVFSPRAWTAAAWQRHAATLNPP